METLYTAIYRPADGALRLRWPELELVQSLAGFTEGQTSVPVSSVEPLLTPPRP